MYKKIILVLIKKATILFPLLYIAAFLLGCIDLNLKIFIFFIILGGIINYSYSSYIEDETLKIIPKRNAINDSLVSWKFWKGMKPWEMIHWMIVLVFFSLTAWAMWEGLSLLFIHNTENLTFVTIFTICVTCTLLWLVGMITRGKHFWGYIMFYLIFDLLSAFSFNYIHFFDNVSVTQRVDATMKACQMFSDLEGTTISEIKKHAENDSTKMIGKEESKSQTKKKIQNEAKQTIKTLDEDFKSGRITEKEYKKEVKKIRKEENILSNKANQKEETIDYTLSDIFHKTDSIQHILNNLCDEYTTNKSSFTLGQMNLAKGAVRDINSNLQAYRTNFNIKISQSHKDSVNYILETINQKGKNRFESFVELFNLFAPNAKDSNNIHADFISNNKGSIYETLIKQEKNLEKGIMYQSIALSALIDAVPLVLGIFVAWAKRKDDN